MKLLIYGSGFIANNLIKHFKNCYIDTEIVLAYNRHKVEDAKDVKQVSINETVADILLQEKPEYIVILQGNSFVAHNTDIELSTRDNMLKSATFLEKIYDS
ncbi:MAG TPA: hypothetical protein PKW30_07775, partial [Campylobacterales bacterium]|nr:hypothetical protein [Campylobacterales bacterium]